MIQLAATLCAVLNRLGGSRARCARSADAGRRLASARQHFECSVVGLRKAALDHVDCQDVTGIALRANLARLTGRTHVAD